MDKIFLIPGLGTDTRLYNYIDFNPDYEVIPIDWIEPNETDTLTTYAQKLIHQYNITPKSIVVGTSLGGMLAIEIARKVTLKKTILISSIKTIKEAPWYFGVIRAVPFLKLIPGKVFPSIGFIIKPIFGKFDKSNEWLFNDMLRKSSPVFLKWAIGATLRWDNMIIPPNTYHIHGDKDRIFPYRYIKDATLVKGGTHIMVFDKAKQVNKWLRSILKK